VSVVATITARQGRKLLSVPHREIVVAADEYLRNHPELIAEARETIERWTLEGVFGKRAQRALADVHKISKN
jgi:hypothetical protein